MLFRISGRRLITVSLENGQREERVIHDAIIVRLSGNPPKGTNEALITFAARYAIARTARRLGFSFFNRSVKYLGADFESTEILSGILPKETRKRGMLDNPILA